MQTDAWLIEKSGTDNPDIVDLRDLEAPEPLHRVLLAASDLGPDEVFLARLPHVPHPLFPLLEERNLCWWVHEEPDRNVLLAVKKAP